MKNQLEIWVDRGRVEILFELHFKFVWLSAYCLHSGSRFYHQEFDHLLFFIVLLNFVPHLLAVLWNLFVVTQFCYSRGSSWQQSTKGQIAHPYISMGWCYLEAHWTFFNKNIFHVAPNFVSTSKSQSNCFSLGILSFFFG